MKSYDSEDLSQRRRSRAIFLIVSATLALTLILWSREVLLPFILALLVAYVLMPAVERVERLRLPRWAAVLVVYSLTLGGLYASIAMTAPRLVSEMAGLVRDAPALVKKVQEEQLPSLRKIIGKVAPAEEIPDEVTPPLEVGPPPPPAPPAAVRIIPHDDGTYEVALGPGIEIHQSTEGRWRIEQAPPAPTHKSFDLARFVSDAISKAVEYTQRNTLEVIKLGQAIITSISRAIFIFFMTLMLAAYLMITREKIVEFFRSLVFPEARNSFDRLLVRVDRGLAGVIRGQLLICLVNGALSALGFSIFGLKYWPVLAVLAGVMSLVPIFGSILSTIPIVAIALTQSFGHAVEILLWIVGIHQLEANFLNPKIIGDAAKIHPFLVVFALLVGEHFFKLSGALMAVPVLSIVQSIFLHFRQVTFGDDAPPDSLMSLPPPAKAKAGKAAAAKR